MPAPILAGIGKVVMGVVTGTAKGLAAGARVASTTAKSSGKLVQSASNVRTNIVKSNKRIQKIKLNRRRINRSIFNEKKRKQREKRLESKPKRESGLGGMLASPLAAGSGIKKFIMTLLFGLAITNIDKIKRFLDKIIEGFKNFGELMMNIINPLSFITGLRLGTDDGKKFSQEMDNVKRAFDIPGLDNLISDVEKKTLENKKNLPITAVQKGVVLKEVAKTIEVDRSNIGGKYLSVEEEIVQERTKIQNWGLKNAPADSLNLLPGGGYWKKIKFWEDLRNLKKQSEKKIRLKWEDGNPYLQSKGVDNSRLNTLNSDSVGSENTVIINQPIIKKEYVPLPYH